MEKKVFNQSGDQAFNIDSVAQEEWKVPPTSLINAASHRIELFL